ncbi:MAG TPA: hypothetical protein PKN96_07320 [Flavobacterium sp.]|uniref:pirin family protein n=1 Tax=Flavobacterium sp. TaxID=239 RepID=UPI002C586B19|nr:hypothetical protein [Flavobacterium sp.]HNP33086.1 hypothetical protein [Flavobacterium sp.]
MLPQASSQIYKAQLRFHDEDENYRCLSTLNFGNYFDENRKAFGNLKVLNDETLAPQQTKSFSAEKGENIILIPLVGTIDYSDDFGNKNYIKTEEIQVLEVSEKGNFKTRNPYETELINYLQIRLESDSGNQNSFDKNHFDFGIPNELFTILRNEGYSISIGIFSGRSEGIYHLKNKSKGAFAFVINGAFEFQNRLLESRDGLSIWDVSEIEFEALSENAILLLIETRLK